MQGLALIGQLPGFATAFLLLFARVGAMLMCLPVFSEDAVPGRIRLLMSLGLTLGLFGLLSAKLPHAPDNQAAYAAMVVVELMIGLALGTLVKIMFTAVSMAGGLISLQIGLTSALVSDPAMGGQVTVLSKLMSVAAAIVCMSMGVHHVWIGALVHSYTMFPVGVLPSSADFAQLVIATVSRATELGLGLAAPLIVYGIVFNVALGLAARLAPAIQVFFIAQPLNLLLGLGITALLMAAMLGGFAQAMSAWTRSVWG